VRPVAITHEDHFVNVARRRARAAALGQGGEKKGGETNGGGLFCDQFENLANARAHFEGTGPEIWEQVRTLAPTGGEASVTTNAARGKRTTNARRWFPFSSRAVRRNAPKFLDAFVCACGTGGTLAGVASFLRRADARIECFLVDPQGSSLYNKVTRGVLYTHQEAEGKRLRNPFDTITEGVGINRLTKNFAVALGTEALFPGESDGSQASLISGAFRCSDREAVEMSRFLARTDGLFLGSSSCVNVVGAVKAARRLGPGKRVVTIACDGGGRHLSKFWSAEYLEKHGLTPTARGLEFLEDT
jgi:cysteine synthase A